MKDTLVLLLFLFTPIIALSQGDQDKILSIDTTWYEGAIIRNDGTKVKGEVRYNEALGLVNFRDEDHEQASYPATRIAGFEYFDRSQNRWRNLVSIENFNELLLDSETFRVWSKVEPLFTRKERHYNPGIPGMTGPTMSTSESTKLSEIIYITDPKTERFHVLLRLESKVRSRHIPIDPSSKKRGDINIDILRQILGYKNVLQLDSYAKHNDLNWRKKNDLIDILRQAEKL